MAAVPGGVPRALLLSYLLLAVLGLVTEDDDSFLGNAVFFAFVFGLFLGIPSTSAIAILRYHLYDLDVV